MSNLVMKNKPPEFDAAFMHVMWHVVSDTRAVALMALIHRISQWKVAVLERHAERPVGKYYADHCEVCEGKGKVHICVDPWCENEIGSDQKFCAHPTPHEIRELNEIHTAYLHLLEEARVAFLEKGTQSPSASSGVRKHNHDVGPN